MREVGKKTPLKSEGESLIFITSGIKIGTDWASSLADTTGIKSYFLN